ncbi:MAG: DUF342 domain-containing protein [Lachnospiraceae bacterium]|nr:DUF342 domain-containing protein [Lachnospiraceae bacterium]
MEMDYEIQSEVQETVQDDWALAGNYISISEDSMQAFLFLQPKPNGERYDREELKAHLRAEGVVSGFHESNLAAMAKKKVYNREVLVAEGVLPVQGTPGYYAYEIETEDFTKHPRIREDGSVDYQSMNLLQNVQEGQVLAVYHAAVQGTDGEDVRGRRLRADLCRELPALRGRGIALKEDAEEPTYIAQTEGKLIFRDDQIEICNVHEIKGDVDILIGKVEFFGDVVIDGNVAAGTIIRAGKSLTISGTVESADIYAGGDIILRRGVQGNEKGRIRSRGNVYADFLEHCTVEARGNVMANYFLNSEVAADGEVTATGKRGMILGGYVHGFQGIKAMCVGSEKEIKTILHAGCEQKVYEQNVENRREEAEIMEQLEEMEERAEILRKQLAIRSKDQTLIRECNELLQERQKLTERAKQLQAEKQKLQNQMEKGRQSAIRVEDKLFAGSVISVNNAQQAITANTCFMQYKSISGIIQGTVIRI